MNVIVDFLDRLLRTLNKKYPDHIHESKHYDFVIGGKHSFKCECGLQLEVTLKELYCEP